MIMIPGRKVRSSKSVLSREGKHLGYRHVLYCPSTKLYIDMTGLRTTESRFYAWSGTPAQARKARLVFGIGEEYILFADGDERGG